MGKEICTPYSYGAASIPLDNFPVSLDANKNATFDLIRNFGGAIPTALVDLYKTTLGVFEFKTRLSASQLSIGQTIQLTHPRLGWKAWTTIDPASPDNIAAVDSTKAVVIGINTDLNTNIVTLKVFRRIPGSYPIADLN